MALMDFRALCDFLDKPKNYQLCSMQLNALCKHGPAGYLQLSVEKLRLHVLILADYKRKYAINPAATCSLCSELAIPY
jgi:hypothetical protein